METQAQRDQYFAELTGQIVQDWTLAIEWLSDDPDEYTQFDARLVAWGRYQILVEEFGQNTADEFFASLASSLGEVEFVA